MVVLVIVIEVRVWVVAVIVVAVAVEEVVVVVFSSRPSAACPQASRPIANLHISVCRVKMMAGTLARVTATAAAPPRQIGRAHV